MLFLNGLPENHRQCSLLLTVLFKDGLNGAPFCPFSRMTSLVSHVTCLYESSAHVECKLMQQSLSRSLMHVECGCRECTGPSVSISTRRDNGKDNCQEGRGNECWAHTVPSQPVSMEGQQECLVFSLPVCSQPFWCVLHQCALDSWDTLSRRQPQHLDSKCFSTPNLLLIDGVFHHNQRYKLE